MTCRAPSKGLRLALTAALALALSACGDSQSSAGSTGGTGGTRDTGSAGTDGSAGNGGNGGIQATGGTGGIDPTPREQEVLFVGGFMSELYEALSLHLEDAIHAALRQSVRRLNVHIDLPLNQSVDIPIGDAISNALPRIPLPLEAGGFISFHTQEAYFAAEGIASRNISRESLAFNSSETVEHNAAAILDYLLQAHAQRTQVVIVSHSKGGLDTLEALLHPNARELLADTVVGWVALQAPFYGSPVADPAPSAINAVLLSAVGGNGESLDDLKTAGRESYMAARAVDTPDATDLGDLSSAIPIISAYSSYEAGITVAGFATLIAGRSLDSALFSQITQLVIDNYWATPLDIPGVISRSTASAVALIRQRVASSLDAALGSIGLMDLTNTYMNGVVGVPNDGLVPRDSTALPGAIHRELELGDHASPVMDVDPLKNFWTAQERNAVTRSLVEEVRALADDRKGAP